ncbi:MAG: hypothetical protein DCC71_00165 [Proteobacteria bacterium]|nr:MAG: hypothetical protein DCC71_00165 [Pseudomonadota bacterium]
MCFVSGDKPPAELRTPLVLSLLAFPAAISWAVVRYRLLDPPAWARSAFLTGLTALVALLGASGLVALASSLIGEPAAALSAEVVPVALTTAILYQLLHLGLRRSAGSRVLRERAFEHFLEAASREMAAARDPNEVLDRIDSLVRAHLGASSVQCVTDLAGALDGTPLVRRGLDLWLGEGAPVDRMVRSSTRAEDPGPELPEIVLPLTPPDMPNALVVLSSRSDGLPYDDEHERMLASLRHIATNALQASATTAHLEARVEEKTSSLERALADRQAVLHSARAICEAGDVGAVRETIREFAVLRGLSDGNDALAPSRHEELLPQLATLSAFADLAIGRLELLAELKREVEQQAQEIAEISPRRLHAEFVRGAAHELRKPTETVRSRVEQLAASLPPELSPTVERIRAASREMSRRLDLLLFHSGLRLDLQRIDLIRIVDDAVAATRASGAVRDVRVHHELPRLRMLADPSRLLSVVENLLDNAVKATEPGQRISVRTSLERNRSHRGNWVRLDVLDEGRGISPEQLDQIFEPGVAFEASGFGLGLSLCREIVRMHGGSIAVESQRGCTVFRIRLPQFRSGEGDDGNGRDSAG